MWIYKRVPYQKNVSISDGQVLKLPFFYAHSWKEFDIFRIGPFYFLWLN